jgi:hypothetical protein
MTAETAEGSTPAAAAAAAADTFLMNLLANVDVGLSL